MIQRVSDPFDDLVMDSNKSLKSIYKGSRRNGVRMAKRKKGMTFIPYDYEAAYNKSLEDMNTTIAFVIAVVCLTWWSSTFYWQQNSSSHP